MVAWWYGKLNWGELSFKYCLNPLDCYQVSNVRSDQASKLPLRSFPASRRPKTAPVCQQVKAQPFYNKKVTFVAISMIRLGRILCKLPGESIEIPWHQDSNYWPLEPMKVTIQGKRPEMLKYLFFLLACTKFILYFALVLWNLSAGDKFVVGPWWRHCWKWSDGYVSVFHPAKGALFFDGIRNLPLNHRANALLLSVQHNGT